MFRRIATLVYLANIGDCDSIYSSIQKVSADTRSPLALSRLHRSLPTSATRWSYVGKRAWKRSHLYTTRPAGQREATPDMGSRQANRATDARQRWMLRPAGAASKSRIRGRICSCAAVAVVGLRGS